MNAQIVSWRAVEWATDNERCNVEMMRRRYFDRSKFQVRSTNIKTYASFETVVLLPYGFIAVATIRGTTAPRPSSRYSIHHVAMPLAHRDAIRDGRYFRVESPRGDTLESIRLA
jgi:hypothetical protein